MYYQRLRDLRNDSELMQKQIAEYLKIDQRVYSTYETGKRDIPTRFIVKLAKFYDVPADYILGLTNITKPYPQATLEWEEIVEKQTIKNSSCT